MGEDWPTNSTVYLLRLKLVEAESPGNMQKYYEVLSRMISVVQLTEASFKVIMGRIHGLVSDGAIRLACKSLDELLTKRALVLERDDWIEKTFVTRLWVTVQDQSLQEEVSLPSLQRLLDAMMKKLEKPLSPTASHAGQVLLWKIADVLYSQEKYEMSSSWCKIAQHPIFDKSGELNQAKICR
jgi:hypothetical protein